MQSPAENHNRAYANWEYGVYIFIIVLAFVLRLWDLDARAYHYDEGLHALYSWRLYAGEGYSHEAWMHGPFQFIFNWPIFKLFGASDFTARLLPAFFGTALVGLPFLIRRQLGRWGAIAVALLLTFSPFLLYYSRYARNDIYNAFFILLTVVCMWRYNESSKARYLYIAAAALSLGFCAKEVAYINVGILALFLIVIGIRDLIVRLKQGISIWQLSPINEFAILVGTLCLPLFSGFIQLIPGVDLGSGYHWAKLLTLIIFAVSSAYIGLTKLKWWKWLISVAIFYGIFILLHTTFFTNMGGFESGFWGAVDYWIEQHDVQRGGQPVWYYLYITPIYEFLPMFFAAVGGIYYIVKGNTFSRFFVYWAILTLILYSYAGERMPWLSVHIVVPMICVAGMFIGHIIQSFKRRLTATAVVRVGILVLVLAMFILTVRVSLQTAYQVEDLPPQMTYYAGISADVPRVIDQIEELAQETGQGTNMTITVGFNDIYFNGFAWPLREYKKKFKTFSSTGPDSEPTGSVVVIHKARKPGPDAQYMDKYDEGEEFYHLIWPPEDYKNKKGLGEYASWWWSYFWNRETDWHRHPEWQTGDSIPLQSQKGVVYFLRDNSGQE